MSIVRDLNGRAKGEDISIPETQTIVEWPQSIIYSKKIIDTLVCIFNNEKTIYLPVELSEIGDSLKAYAMNLNLPWMLLVSVRSSVRIQKEIVQGSKVTDKMINALAKMIAKASGDEIKSSKQARTVTFFDFVISCSCSLSKIMNLVRNKKILTNDPFYKTLIKFLEERMKQDNRLSKQNSQLYENTIEDYLQRFNVEYQTEDEQRLANLSGSREPSLLDMIDQPATPDFLLTKRITIVANDITMRNIGWIDAKNYTGLDLPYILTSLKKQGRKYRKYFGPGVFVFHHGLSSEINLHIPDVYLLSHSEISIQ